MVLEETADDIKKVKEEFAGASDALGQMNNGISNVSTNLSTGLNRHASDSIARLQALGISGGDASKVLNALGVSMMGASKTLEGFSQASGLGKASMAEFNQDAKKMFSYIEKLSNIPGLGGFGRQVAAAMGRVSKESLAAYENVNNFQSGLVNLLAQSGQLGASAADRAQYIKEVDSNSVAFAGTIKNVAQSLNMLPNEVSKVATDLLKLPGAFSRLELSMPGLDVSMNQLQASLIAVRGTTGNAADLQTILKERFELVGRSAMNSAEGFRKSLGVLTQLSDTANRIGIPFSHLQQHVSSISKSLASFGDNAEAAIRMTNGLGKALLDSGAGPAQFGRILESVTSNIANMDQGAQAFLSAQTGGAGGLQGSFEIDLLKAQGKTDEIYAKVERALRQQFGGRIVSLEEAASNQASAAELTRQVQFLQSGPFGKLVGNRGDALALLRSFNQGTTPDAGMPTREQSLAGAAEQNNAVQERQANLLGQIVADTKYLKLLESIKMAQTVRESIGNTELNKTIQQQSREEAVVMGRNLTGTVGTQVRDDALPVSVEDQRLKALQRAVATGISAGQEATQRFGEYTTINKMIAASEAGQDNQRAMPRLRAAATAAGLSQAPVRPPTAGDAGAAGTTVATAQQRATQAAVQKIGFEPLIIKIEGLNDTIMEEIKQLRVKEAVTGD